MALSSLLSRCVPGLALLAPLLGGSAPERADGALPPASEGVEHFVLAWTGEGPVPGPAGPKRAAARRDGIVGFARMRRHRGAAGVQLELELEWPAEDLRVYAVERLREGAARLVWREMGPGRGRTLRAEWAPDGASLETAAWDHGGRRARSASLDEGGVLPQYLVELARSGRAVGGRFRVFDPLSGGFEERELTTCYEAAGGPEGGPLERVVRLRRRDGTLAGEYRYRGDDLVAFRLQNGRVEARVVGEETWREARARVHATPEAASASDSEPSDR